MAQAGGWEARLEAVGLFLAKQEARQVEIVDEGTFLAVLWDSSDGDGTRQQCYLTDTDLNDLLETATTRSAGWSSWPSILAALGRELKQTRIEVARIAEESDGFLVTGSITGVYTTHRFTYSTFMPRYPEFSSELEPDPLPSSVMPAVPTPVVAAAAAEANPTPLRSRIQQLAS
jgi:hypothetical protein